MSSKPSKTKILMVCLGNICRSPIAHGILESKLSNDFVIDSAGTAAYHIGKKPDPRSIHITKLNGIDINSQRVRQFTAIDFEVYDTIYAMDTSNYQNILALAQTVNDKEKVKLILNENNVIVDKNVPDPYYGGDSGFEHVFHILNETCSIIANKLQS